MENCEKAPSEPLLHVPMYLHGLEGSPKGTKGAWMTERYGASAPEMPAKSGVEDAFTRCVEVARKAVHAERPSLIVGSSYGGAVLMKLVLDGDWSGPCVFLAQAAVKLGVGRIVPSHVPAILIHAPDDEIVPYEDSALVARESGPLVELWTVRGDHRLHHIIEDGTLERAVNQLLGL